MLIPLYKIGELHFRLSGRNGFHVKAKSERFTAASSRCCQNLKYGNFAWSFGRLRQNIATKSVPHVQHDYFSSFNQSNHWFAALSLTLPSSNVKLPTDVSNTVRTLTRRAHMFCDSDDISTDETKHSNTAFIKNNHSTGFIERNTYVRPKDSSNKSYTTTATIPYVRRTSETIARLLRPYNIRVARKPMFTLRRLLTNVKGKDVPGAVYKIECSDCQATYIGETGRNLTRLNEHKRAAKRVTSTTTSLKTT